MKKHIYLFVFEDDTTYEMSCGSIRCGGSTIRKLVDE